MEPIYLLTQTISEKVSIPEDQIRMLLSLILCIPLGLIFRLLPSRLLRDIYGTFFGLALQTFVYGQGIFVTLLQTTITYLIILAFKRKAAKLVFVESMIFQSIYHIYRQYVDYGGWKLDISTIVMMYTCKYTSFAFCYEDGGKPDEKLSQGIFFLFFSSFIQIFNFKKKLEPFFFFSLKIFFEQKKKNLFSRTKGKKNRETAKPSIIYLIHLFLLRMSHRPGLRFHRIQRFHPQAKALRKNPIFFGSSPKKHPIFIFLHGFGAFIL